MRLASTALEGKRLQAWVVVRPAVSRRWLKACHFEGDAMVSMVGCCAIGWRAVRYDVLSVYIMRLLYTVQAESS